MLTLMAIRWLFMYHSLKKQLLEARRLMLASKNLLKPADGEPIISPSKDMVLGVYYLTVDDNRPHKGDGSIFADIDEVELAYRLDQVEFHAKIKLRTNTWYDDKNNYRGETSPASLLILRLDELYSIEFCPKKSNL